MQCCRFHDHQGQQCQQPALHEGLCYWHDGSTIKDDPNLAEKLEAYARSGGMLQGISLKHANLVGLNLVNYGHQIGFDLSGADLYRSDLRGAHLFNINFHNASLMKANLSEANIQKGNVQGANLLGVKWSGTKIDGIHIGNELRQERGAQHAVNHGKSEDAVDLFEQAEEIYRDLRKAAEAQGIFTMAGTCLRKELTMRRYQMPRFGLRRLISKAVDLFCGYGEEPLRVVLFSIAIIVVSSLFYYSFGISFSGKLTVFQSDASSQQNLITFFECLYYSVVTFTTLGYGDFTPVGLSRAVAAIEAFVGSFTLALFVVVFVKKMTR